MPNMALLLRHRNGTARTLLFLFLLALAGCSDQAPEPKPTAQVNATPASATLANATAAAPDAANATVALADVLAGNATLLAPDLSPEAANATLAACALPVPARAQKAPAKAEKTPDKATAPVASVPAKPKATASVAPAKPKAKASAAPAGPLTLERAQQEFSSFARQWVVSLSRNMLGNAAHMTVSPDGGDYVARFAEVEQDSMETEVKATDSPTCPYVGILKYFECSYESRGNSPDAAKTGSFSRVRKVRVTELFRHSGARWE